MTLLSLIKSHWFRIASVIVILSLVVLLGTPLLARYLAQQWLMENGGEQVYFEDVDFNPFAAKLVLEGLEVKVNTETTLSFDAVAFDLAWLPLLRRQVDVRSVQLTGFHMVVDNREPEAPRVGGILLPGADPETEPPATEKSAWLSGIQALTLQDFHILVRDRKLELDVVLDSLRLTSMAQWTPEQAATLELAGRINDAPVRIKGQLAPFAEHPRYDLDLSVDKLQLGSFEQLVAPKIDQLSGLLSYAGKLVFEQSDANLSLSEDGKIVIESLRMAMGEPGLETSIGQFSLDGRLAFKQSGESVLLEQDGAASLDSLDVSVRQPALDVHNTKLELMTRVNFSDSPSGAEMRVASDISMEGLDVKASQRKINLVRAKTLKVEELLFQAVDELSISTISSEQIQVGKLPGEDTEQPQTLARSDKLQITGLSLSGRLINIESVAYDGFHNRIVRDSDGNLNVVRFINVIENLNAPPEAAEQTGEDLLQNTGNEEQAEPVDLQVGSIRVSEGSSVTFIDDSVKPAFATTVTFQEISLEQLDTRKPDQNSPLRLQGAIGKHTRLSLSGNVKPFLKPASLNLSGKIQAMDLPALSSYTWKSLGLMLDSGTLDADLKLASKDEILDGQVDLLLHQLKLGKVESQSGLQSKIPVPMDTALNTLRDKNNTIKLTVPVKGNMADPKFDINDAINQVLAKALKTGALSYLKHALQPYGALITAAQYVGEAVAKVRLNPVEFEAGQATLTATGTEYLVKVAKVMRERPKITIKVCGVAVQQDQLFFQQQQQQAATGIKAPSQPPAQPSVPDEKKLTDLAMDRATVVKDHLVEKHRIPAAHLVGCRPRIEADQADAKPRTDLLI